MTIEYETQFKLSDDLKNVKNRLREICCNISDRRVTGELEGGLLIALGDYFQGVPAARQLGINSLQDRLLTVFQDDFQETLESLMRPDSTYHDGAIIVDRTGQVLGASVYLEVEHPNREIDEGCSTRHLAANSYSMRPETIRTYTVSEETGKVRIYFSGERIELYDPVAEKDKEQAEKIITTKKKK
ncbi:MAG: DNA integrity scanning protein DisA nucleotide-binding domain protein [archaeon]